ncbi:hypothetical protein AAFN86_00315 [Roseomonas sp. CAU 1739]|uniref:hypothetical protein n=1 Tax=Roseomonas sp. CAU 1739 TaxID=3140364 RepID=UPI00325BA35A
MLFGGIFRRGNCRCGSASDIHPLRAEPVQPQRGGDPALGPAFGPLPAPLESWLRFEEKSIDGGTITIVYTLDAKSHPLHALPPERRAAPAGPEPCKVAEIDLGQVADPAHPAHVQRIARMAAHSLKVFGKLGFEVPKDLTIHLCTFGGEDGANYRGGTEVWLDHVWVSTRLDGADALLTVAHEIFHRVQYEYNPTTAKTSQLYAALREGGARLAEDWVLDSGDRYLKDGIEFLDDPGRPLIYHGAPGGEIAPHSYAAALFWRWLCEQHGEIARDSEFGHEVMRTILKRMVNTDGYSLLELREARGMVVGEGHLDRFAQLSVANGEVLSTETDWGNFLVANWMHATGKPKSDRRFDYVENDEGGGRFSRKRPFVWPGETLQAGKLAAKPYVFEIPQGAVRAGFAARYTVVDLGDAPPSLLKVDFAVEQGMGDPLVQILMVGRDAAGQERLKDLIRIDSTRWTRFVPTTGLTQVVVIVAAREESGRYRLAIGAAAGRAVLHVTPWNAAAGTSYETDPRDTDRPWNWTSPDLMLDGKELRLRVTNRGDAPSEALTVTIHAQGTVNLPLQIGPWHQVGEAASLPPIAPGAVGEVRIPWQPPRMAASATSWGLRATVAGGSDGRLVVLSSIGKLPQARIIDMVL